MDLLQMKYVVAISENESMTRAAQQLHISQSALSLSYKRLEEELGVKLFIRNGRTLRLTTAGKKFRDKARLILDMVGELEQEMTEKNILEFSSEVGDFTNEASMLYNSFFPDVEIFEKRENAAETLRAVKDGEVPFAVTCRDCSDEILVSELILDEPMYAFVNARSPIANMEVLTMEQFQDKPLIIQRDDYSIAGVMLSFFEQAGMLPGRRHFVNDPESMTLSVFNNKGQTFIPESIVHMWMRVPFALNAGTKMIPMAEDFCRRQIYLTHHRFTSKSPLVQRYMEYLRNFGFLVQRIRDIPTDQELANYAEKYWPEFSKQLMPGAL